MENENKLSTNPLDRPEIIELFGTLMHKLLSESGRGAVLIGTNYVDEYLTEFITSIFPAHTKEYRNKMLTYPGPLSSFSSKIELLYAFRYISKPFYNSLNALRRIRNDAAHNSTEFAFVSIKERFEQIFSFISPSVFVRDEALKMMVKMKVDTMETIFNEHKMDQKFREEKAREILGNSEFLRQLEDEQLPHWQLILGLSLPCGFLMMKKEAVLKALDGRKSWSEVA